MDIVKNKLFWGEYTTLLVLNNMGVESFNDTIKEEKTLRQRLSLGEMAEAVQGLVQDSSQKDDTHLFGNR